MEGLTQYQLGRRVGLHMNYISDLELGKRNPSLTTLCRLARGLRVKARDLVEEIDTGLARDKGWIELGLRFPEEEAISHLRTALEILEGEGLGDEERRRVIQALERALRTLRAFSRGWAASE